MYLFAFIWILSWQLYIIRGIIWFGNCMSLIDSKAYDRQGRREVGARGTKTQHVFSILCIEKLYKNQPQKFGKIERLEGLEYTAIIIYQHYKQ